MKPKHQKAAYFAAKGLFSNLLNFYELENKISSLPETERGDAFEVFAEAYFRTQDLHQAAEVWPEKQLPESLRKKLGIPNDAGIDGVLKTNTDIYISYQVKFRSNRNSLSWDNDGLGKFLGQSDRVSQRILFTNSNDLSTVMDSRINFKPVKGNDLDRLNHEDFQTIENWLKTGLVQKHKNKPYPHQVDAINNILNELSINDRATAIMACGTGKTLLGLWVAEKQNVQTVLILLPSLALVRQTLHSWAKENNWDTFNFLCVCSDNTVIKGDDETILYQNDLDFSVTIQKKVVEDFLKNKNISRKVIFSTYQSCQIVAQVIPKDFSFDLAIFDEAHKTASRKDANYAFALQNENLPIKKRLFLTATPRHYKVNTKDKEGNQRLVYSMDDQKSYGRVAHQLSFRGAVQKDLICDYKVIISIVTSDMVNRAVFRKGEVVFGGDIIKAERIANILALKNAIEQYNVKRIFSFHNSVASAKSFTASTNEGVGVHLKDFNTLHVNGAMPTTKRESFLKEFEESKKAIISNARCLTEGVNVPAVDMVAFVAPKKSRVDIVQAVGRAMRKHEESGKKLGYILLPIFLQISENETIEQALAKTKFDTAWDVLQALQEQDESLVEIIAQMREERGKALGMNDNKLREKIEILGPELCINELRKSITTKIVNSLGSNWDERFGELEKFKEEHGHCNVPYNYQESKKLGVWVSIQREAYRKKILTLDRYEKLTNLGINWRLKASWEERFSEFVDFKKENGCSSVPYNDKNKNLMSWVANQRIKHKKRTLSSERFEALNNIGFEWNGQPSWDARFTDLVKFKEEHGHCNVPYSLPIGIWAGSQRRLYKQGLLTSDKCKKLNDIGFEWDPINAEWENKFIELVAFKKENGHCNASRECPQTKKLGTWIGVQRKIHKKGLLAQERYKRLNALGFVWDIKNTIWNERFAELNDFKKQYGRCMVPYPYPANRKLGTWVTEQRKSHKEGLLAQERYKKLNDLGFVWDRNNSSWEQMFAELLSFKDKNGHCNVSARYNVSKKLMTWVSQQRHLYKMGGNQLFLKRIDKLNAIGFIWDANVIEGLWKEKFAELVDFKKKNGHCRVPKNYGENPALSRWVQTQRYLYNTKNKRLTAERLELLNKIGFFVN
ncbi:MAG: Helicase associated domain protein [Candidatus Babeliales bacterium]